MPSAGTVSIQKQPTGVIIIQNFSFIGTNGIANAAITITEGGSWKTDYPLIIQNNDFYLNPSQMILQVTPGGVIYSKNTFHGHLNDGSNSTESIHVKDPNDTQHSWTQTDTFGVNDTASRLSGTIAGTSGFLNTYIEDNTFTNAGTNDFDDGGRVVIRHNTFTNGSSTPIGSHGYGTSAIGLRHYEIYNNNFKNTCSEGGDCNQTTAAQTNEQGAALVRGGTGVFYNNTSDSLYTSAWGSKDEFTFPVDNNHGTDCPADASSYPLFHQVGQGYTTQQITQPIYAWNDKINPGTGTSSTFHTNTFWYYGCSTPITGYMQTLRNYVVNVTQASKPTGTGTWIDSYAAFTYPHPLVQQTTGQAPSPPTGVQAVVN
jgi:hypothetical protein